MACSFRIPGNIKQQMLPFVLAPNKGINATVETSPELKGSDTQYFSFRNIAKAPASGKGKLGIIPQTYEENFHFDIANQLLFNTDKTSITINDILNNIPGIQIREFLPDSKLDQCLNFASDMIAKCKDMFFTKKEDTTSGQVAENLPKDDTSFMKKLMGTIWYAVKYISGNTDPNLFTNMSNIDGLTMEGYPGQSDLKTYILNFPYMMYYRLQSCTSTNIYEVPLAVDNKSLYGSDGTAGWDFHDIGFGNSTPGFLKSIPLGGLLTSIMKSIQVSYLAWWDNTSGEKVHEPEIKISFDLFNDTIDHALINFIFVNTVVPNNRWIQYNMFQHSPCLYDVKIEGVYRMYMCSGKFDVQQKGILRNPSKVFLDKLISAHLNPKYSGLTADSIKRQNLIKIPDVYHVEATFSSILPANFNTFIFNYAQNNNHIDTYSGHAYDPSAFSQLIPAAVENFATQVKACWNNGGKDPGKSKISDIDAKVLGG